MIKSILFGIIVWALVSGGISLWLHSTGREKFTIMKTLVYGFATAIVSVGLLSAIVVLF
jgi:hypothetical protein